MDTDPHSILMGERMNRLQVLAVALTVCLNGIDGYDVLSISFASPGIASAWGINRAALGLVLSMELMGMAVGSILIGSLADRLGRRPVLLGCLVLMATGMLMATTASGVTDLSVWRLLTGFGIGGMLAATNAAAAEFASTRRRNLCVSLMAIGYPLGAVIGGHFAAVLLQHHDWRTVFLLGACTTAAFLPLVWLWVPESPVWLYLQQPAGALARLNHALARLGCRALTSLPSPPAAAPKLSITDIFAPGLAGTTILMTLAYALHITTFYFIIKWVPKIVVDMGFAPAAAAGVLVWANVGGATGGALLGLVAQRLGARRVTIVALVLSVLMVTWFGHGQATLHQLALICAATGFFTNAGVVGIYALLAQVFPTHVRAFGTGFVIGIGRGGSALAPLVAGLLFTAGFGLQFVAIAMSAGSLVAALALLRLRVAEETVHHA